MGRLNHLTLDQLHNQLEQTEGNIPTQRVLAAIGRTQGDTLTELATRHNVVEKTIRNWLDRFRDQPLDKAPYDGDRPGRPPKLDGRQRKAFLNDLQASPKQAGYDRESWFPELAHRHLQDAYGMECSLRHVYRLMDEAGLVYRSARPQHYKADPERAETFRETVQKKTQSMSDDWTFVAVDQSSKYLGTVQRRGWYEAGSRPRRRVWNARTKVTTLGAITEEGEQLFFGLEESRTAEHGVALLKAWVAEFGDKLVVLLDRAPYFYARDVWAFVSGERQVQTVEGTEVACVQGTGWRCGIFRRIRRS
jgi:transposase